MKSKLIFLSAMLALAGCQATQLAATPRSISFNGLGNATLQDATVKAQVHCQKFGRDAELIPSVFENGVTNFRCVDK